MLAPGAEGGSTWTPNEALQNPTSTDRLTVTFMDDCA